MVVNNTVGNVSIHLDTKRIDANIREAQKKLNMQVKADCDRYTPHQQGQLRGFVRYPQGLTGGEIEWYSVYAHYQYEGELYLAENGSSWAHYGEKKYPSGKALKYHTEGTGARWFDVAKKKHCKEWVDLVKRTVGKG